MCGGGVRLEAWLRLSAPRFGGVDCRGHAQCPAFVPDPLLLLLALQKWQLGFFWSFCIFCPEFAPTVHAHTYF